MSHDLMDNIMLYDSWKVPCKRDKGNMFGEVWGKMIQRKGRVRYYDFVRLIWQILQLMVTYTAVLLVSKMICTRVVSL